MHKGLELHVFSINKHEQSFYLVERWIDCHQCVQIPLFPSSVDASGTGRYPRGNCEPPCALWLLSLAQRWSIHTEDPGGIRTQRYLLHSSTNLEKLGYLKNIQASVRLHMKQSQTETIIKYRHLQWCFGGHMLSGGICVLKWCVFLWILLLKCQSQYL